jgi:hypothetical protein
MMGEEVEGFEARSMTTIRAGNVDGRAGRFKRDPTSFDAALTLWDFTLNEFHSDLISLRQIGVSQTCLDNWPEPSGLRGRREGSRDPALLLFGRGSRYAGRGVEPTAICLDGNMISLGPILKRFAGKNR